MIQNLFYAAIIIIHFYLLIKYKKFIINFNNVTRYFLIFYLDKFESF